MSPTGLDAWTKARLLRDIVLDDAFVDQMVARAAPGYAAAVREYLEKLQHEQIAAQRTKAAEDADIFIATNTRYLGGVSEADRLESRPDLPRVLIADLRRQAEHARVTEGPRLTRETPVDEDSPR